MRRLAGLLVLALMLAACVSGAERTPVEDSPSPATAEASAASIVDEAESSPEQSPSARPSAAAAASAAPTVAPTAVPTPKPGTVTVTPILMYHYIRELPPNTPDQLGYGLSVAPKLFDDQLAYLARAGYQSISMDELVSHMTKGTPLPPKPVVLTFDDGYADFYSAAWPLLKKDHFSATAYIVVDFVGRPGYMSWQQLHELRDSGVEIGAHTMDHVDLAIQAPPQAKRQIAESRQILQQRLGGPVDSFAYPSGRYTTATVKLVGATGFTSAVTTAFGSHHNVSNLLTLARVRVPGGISLSNFIRNVAA